MGKLETEAEELKIRYEKVIRESRKVTEVKDLEMDTVSIYSLQCAVLLYDTLCTEV